jgi:hypothetical protein
VILKCVLSILASQGKCSGHQIKGDWVVKLEPTYSQNDVRTLKLENSEGS